jgi:hypothetical protein
MGLSMGVAHERWVQMGWSRYLGAGLCPLLLSFELESETIKQDQMTIIQNLDQAYDDQPLSLCPHRGWFQRLPGPRAPRIAPYEFFSLVASTGTIYNAALGPLHRQRATSGGCCFGLRGAPPPQRSICRDDCFIASGTKSSHTAHIVTLRTSRA